MKRTAVTIAMAVAVLGALACGTAESGGGAATQADAQVSPQGAEGVPDAPPSQEPPSPIADGVRPPIPAGGGSAQVSGGPCESDADCVPAACCHAKACVDAARKPSCVGVMCTMDCRGGTLDCGGGRCLCKDGQCAAEISMTGFAKAIEGERAKKPAEPQIPPR